MFGNIGAVRRTQCKYIPTKMGVEHVTGSSRFQHRIIEELTTSPRGHESESCPCPHGSAETLSKFPNVACKWTWRLTLNMYENHPKCTHCCCLEPFAQQSDAPWTVPTGFFKHSHLAFVGNDAQLLPLPPTSKLWSRFVVSIFKKQHKTTISWLHFQPNQLQHWWQEGKNLKITCDLILCRMVASCKNPALLVRHAQITPPENILEPQMWMWPHKLKWKTRQQS